MTHKFKNRVFGRSNTVKRLQNSVATILAKALHPSHNDRKSCVETTRPDAGLYDRATCRKYLNRAERDRFVFATAHLPAEKRLFCLMLVWTGARVSEALAITPTSIDLDAGVLSIETLKRRRRGHVRQIPIPDDLLVEMQVVFHIRALQNNPLAAHSRLWPWSRSTAWRCVKQIMQLAGVTGTAATPKGLRHGFGVAAFAAVPPHLVQRWLGHASMRTTAIYGNVSGAEERQQAEKLWDNPNRGKNPSRV